MKISRRNLMLGAGALGASSLLPRRAHASGSMMAAVYPGSWDEAFRSIVAPRLLENHGVEVSFDPLFAVDQIAKARASRGFAAFDTFLLDPGPAAQALASGMFQPIDRSRLNNAASVPDAMITSHSVTAATQIVGIAYNPNAFERPPTKWTDLFESPYVERLGLTGFQTTFGTVSLIEMAKQFGGSDTNVDPVFDELRNILPHVAAIAAPAALPGLFQQGEIDIMYTNTQNTATLADRGVEIAFIAPESGAITFDTTMHIAENAENVEEAYRYMDTVISAEAQQELMEQPYNLVPVNTELELADTLPISSLADLDDMVRHDWDIINPQRADWIERFNREMTR